MKCQIVSVCFFFLKIATFRIGVELCSLLNIMSRNRKSQTMKIHCVTLTTKIFSEHKASVLFVLTVVEMSTTFFSPPFFNENSKLIEIKILSFFPLENVIFLSKFSLFSVLLFSKGTKIHFYFWCVVILSETFQKWWQCFWLTKCRWMRLQFLKCKRWIGRVILACGHGYGCDDASIGSKKPGL